MNHESTGDGAFPWFWGKQSAAGVYLPYTIAPVDDCATCVACLRMATGSGSRIKSNTGLTCIVRFLYKWSSLLIWP